MSNELFAPADRGDGAPCAIAGTADRVLRLTAAALAAGFCLGYGLQIASPLRLNTDAITLLSMAESASDGHGFTDTQFPIGYPAIVVALEKAGVATGCGLVGLNVAALATALACFYWLFRRRLGMSARAAMLVCLLALGSWILIKHVTLPLTDVPFMAAAAVAAVLMATAEAAQGRKKIAFLLSAVLVCGLAISIRTIGIALIPAWAWAAGGKNLASRLIAKPAFTVSLVGLGTGTMILGCYELGQTDYFLQFTTAVNRHNAIGVLADNGLRHLQEFAEIGLNVPISLVHALPRFAILGCGCGMLALYSIGLWSRRGSFGSLDVLAVAYSLIVLVWPFYDPRFWLPVIPLLAAYVFLGCKPLAGALRGRRFLSILATIYCGLFLAFGALAMAYSIRITFAGGQFPQRFGNGALTPTYRAALGQPYESEKINADALRLLRRYDAWHFDAARRS